MIRVGRFEVSAALIATACAFGMLTVAFMPFVSFTAIYPYLVHSGGTVDHSLATLTVVVFWLTGGAVSTPVGWLVDELPIWTVAGGGAAIMGLGLCVAGAMGSQAGIVAGFGLLGGVGSSAVGSVTNFAAISRFVPAGRQRRIAIGFAATGMGMSSIAIQPVASVIVSAGVQAGLWLLAALTLAISAPFVCGYLLLERRGAVVDDAPAGQGGRRDPAVRWSRRAAMRTRTFWLLCAAACCAPAAIQVLLVHQVAIIQDLGGSYGTGVAAATLLGLASIGWRVLASVVSGSVGRSWTYGGAVLLSLWGLGILAGAMIGGWPVRAYVYAVLFSAGYGAFAPMFPAASMDLFGRESFAAIHGLLYASLGLGAATGSWMGGWLRDVSGSYNSALAFSAGAMALSGIAYGLASYTRGHAPTPERRQADAGSTV